MYWPPEVSFTTVKGLLGAGVGCPWADIAARPIMVTAKADLIGFTGCSVVYCVFKESRRRTESYSRLHRSPTLDVDKAARQGGFSCSTRSRDSRRSSCTRLPAA